MEKFKNIFKAGSVAEPEETEEAGIVDEVTSLCDNAKSK